MNTEDQVTISVVSHRQGALVKKLFDDLTALNIPNVRVILTINVPEALPFTENDDFAFQLQFIHNEKQKGFGANHNLAFKHCVTPFFCVLNPDIRLTENPFPALIDECSKPEVGIVAPLIVNELGEREDSARRFPTIASLLRKACSKVIKQDYQLSSSVISPDWVAGMFILFRSDAYRAVGGFDNRYFLYYEDVDICRRFRRRHWDIRLVPAVGVVHAARRQSHRNLRYALWHLRSMWRFFHSSRS